jgi:hypothetical protein
MSEKDDNDLLKEEDEGFRSILKKTVIPFKEFLVRKKEIEISEAEKEKIKEEIRKEGFWL